jgi:iron complex outermembrane receptor protein
MRRVSILALAAASLVVPQAALAQESEEERGEDGAFALGQIIVSGETPEGIAIGRETLTSEAIYAFNRNSLEEAVNLLPGVVSSNGGGARNERLIFVRGFDRFQVPLSIDGIRVYLPYDNRLDFGRFLTPDLAEVQVAKGYVSVLDGPGALGGAINLVTARPTRRIEGEARATLNLDRGLDYAGYNAFARIGTAQDRWYAGASFTRQFTDHWDLAGGFVPTPAEDGGARDLSRTEDWRLNVKAGFTPNAGDEYAISYTRQEGSKNAPLHVTSPQAQAWAWPFWNLDSLYFLSTTALAPGLTLKTRAYLNSFDNLLRGFDDRTQTTQTLTAGRVFNSWYEDEAYGGSAQLDYASGRNRIAIAVHYRRDEHVEYSQVFPTGFIEPPQTSREDTFSVALEDRLHLTPALTLTLGGSYDWRNLLQSDDFVVNAPRTGGTFVNYPLVDADAWNAQGRLDWRPNDASSVHLSLSSRTRFPTLFERFSSRFGGATSNPDLGAERATNLELGGSTQIGAVRIEGAAFHSWLDEAIVAFPFIFNNAMVSQSRNVGRGRYYGAELAVSARIGAALELGGNYTWVERDFTDPSIPAFEPVGVPDHKGFAWAQWTPLEGLAVVPSLEIASDRWTVTPTGTAYYRTGAYVRADLRIDYELARGLVLGAGVRNAFDANFALTDGFPEPGRSVFLSARSRF